MGFFDISVSCFDDCHNSVMGVVVVVVSKLFIKRSHSNKYFNFHNNSIHHITRARGDQGGGISFFISYISLGVCARVQLNTFHVERYRRE